jgi:hypothetical protein
VRCVYFAEIARTDILRCWKLALDKGQNGGRRLDPRVQARGLSDHYLAEVVSDGLVDRKAPILELYRPLPPRSLRKEVADANKGRAGFGGSANLTFENVSKR